LPDEPDKVNTSGEVGRAEFLFRPDPAATGPLRIQDGWRQVALTAYCKDTNQSHRVGELIFRLESKPKPRGWQGEELQLAWEPCPCCTLTPEEAEESEEPGQSWFPEVG